MYAGVAGTLFTLATAQAMLVTVNIVQAAFIIVFLAWQPATCVEVGVRRSELRHLQM